MTIADIEERLSALSKVLQLVSLKEYEAALKGITKKLNKKYYDSDSEVEHTLVVGSVGRGTAAIGESDVDVIYILPENVKSRFDSRVGNVQSALLQEVKDELQSRYSRTDLKGDGQVVVIEFSKFKVEVVPAFYQIGDYFLHPDSNDGGSWKYTYPKIEQKTVWEMQKYTHGCFGAICTILRLWRDVQNVSISGFLLDSIVHDCFATNRWQNSPSSFKIRESLSLCLEYISRQNENQSYWLSLGSNVQIKNPDAGRFIRKAQRFWSELNSANEDVDSIDSVLGKMLGAKYNGAVEEVRSRVRAPREQFIEEESIIALNALTSLDCQVTQDGFRPFSLRSWLSKIEHGALKYLSINKSLDFFVKETAVNKPYVIKWKVRNVGEEAIRRNDERGVIIKGTDRHTENTKFTGPHYVECYLEKDGVCISQTRIDVPIKSDIYDGEHKI